jgi:hypothetical protein
MPTAAQIRLASPAAFSSSAPDLAIKDRVRALYPNDSESYCKNRELIPADLATEISPRQNRYHQLARLQPARASRYLKSRPRQKVYFKQLWRP